MICITYHTIFTTMVVVKLLIGVCKFVYLQSISKLLLGVWISTEHHGSCGRNSQVIRIFLGASTIILISPNTLYMYYYFMGLVFEVCNIAPVICTLPRDFSVQRTSHLFHRNPQQLFQATVYRSQYFRVLMASWSLLDIICLHPSKISTSFLIFFPSTALFTTTHASNR